MELGAAGTVRNSKWDCYKTPPLDTAGHSSGLLGVIGNSKTVSRPTQVIGNSKTVSRPT